MFEVDGVACETWEEALTWARKFVDASPGARLVVAAAMDAVGAAGLPGSVDRCGRRSRSMPARALSLLRDLVAMGRVVHDDTPALDGQVGDGAGASGGRDGGVVVAAGCPLGSVAGGAVGVVGGADPAAGPGVHCRQLHPCHFECKCNYCG